MMNLIFILDCIPFKNAIIIPLCSRICMFLIHFPFRLFLRNVTLEVHILVVCKKKKGQVPHHGLWTRRVKVKFIDYYARRITVRQYFPRPHTARTNASVLRRGSVTDERDDRF